MYILVTFFYCVFFNFIFKKYVIKNNSNKYTFVIDFTHIDITFQNNNNR